MSLTRITPLIAVFAIGCGESSSVKTEAERPDIDPSFAEYQQTLAVMESKDPSVRIAAWQRKWINRGEYRHPQDGVFEKDGEIFAYSWTFGLRDVVLTLTEKDNLDNEDRRDFFIYIDLAHEAETSPSFIDDHDRDAIEQVCHDLQQIVIDAAIELHNSENVTSDAVSEMRGANRLAAIARAFKILVNSGAKFSSSELTGNVYTFRATAEFEKNGKVTASLFLTGQ